MRSNREPVVSRTKTLSNKPLTVAADKSVKPSPRRLEKPDDTSKKTLKKDEPLTPKTTGAVKQSIDKNRISVRSKVSSAMPPQKSTPLAAKRDATVKPNRISLQARNSKTSGPVKTQYFPPKKSHKSLATDAEKAAKVKKMVQQLAPKLEVPAESKDRERTKTRTLSPSEIKFARQLHQVEGVKGEEERPRTATLRSNVEKEDAKNLPAIENKDADYEDDFESYESDFEACESSDSSTKNLDVNTDEISSSSESLLPVETTNSVLDKRSSSAEERKLDSGNFDLPDSKHTQLLHQINESGEADARFSGHQTEHSNPTSLSDEGFDEGVKQSTPNLRMITLVDPKRKTENEKLRQLQQKKRGQEILSMIRLDSNSFTLFEIEPVPYDIFMKFYGGVNCVQTAVQTGEENLQAMIQTDEILSEEKWCQFPARVASNVVSLEQYKQELIGSGCKLKEEETNEWIEREGKVDYLRLSRFLNNVEPTVTSVIKKNNPANVEKLSESTNIPFSKGFVELNVRDKTFLVNRLVSNVVFSNACSWLLITSHGSNTKPYMDEEEEMLSRSLICVWNIFNVDNPEKILVSSGDVNTCDIINGNANLVFAGLVDGTVLVWDLDESPQNHREVYCKKLEKHFLLRSPTYSTATNSTGHATTIVSLQLIKDSIDNLDSNNVQLSTLVCTLDERGKIIIWTVIKRDAASEWFLKDQGLAHWGKVFLAQHTVLSVRDIYPNLKDLHFTVMEINQIDPNHFFIGTNTDYVVHFHRSGRKYHPKLYTSKLTKDVQINRIECCPFSQQYFLVACNDGTVRLHSKTVAKPLMTLINTAVGENYKIDLLQWSTTKACVFYTFDSSNTIHVWDLSASDMFPLFSIPLKEKITSLRVSPINGNATECYMAMALENGRIYLHVLNDEFGIQSNTESLQEKVTFMNYVNRL